MSHDSEDVRDEERRTWGPGGTPGIEIPTASPDELAMLEALTVNWPKLSTPAEQIEVLREAMAVQLARRVGMNDMAIFAEEGRVWIVEGEFDSRALPVEMAEELSDALCLAVYRAQMQLEDAGEAGE